MPVTSQLTRPASRLWVYGSLLLALLLNIIPWRVNAWNIPPDFVALFLFYWAMNQPRRLGLTVAFIMGVLMDVAWGGMLGVHSLIYCFGVYLIGSRQRLFERYSLREQAVLIFILMLIIQLVNLLVNVVFLGGTLQHWGYFLSSLVAAVLWVPLSNIMWWLLQRRNESSSL
jgi:rod shape-determining protein MreD